LRVEARKHRSPPPLGAPAAGLPPIWLPAKWLIVTVVDCCSEGHHLNDSGRLLIAQEAGSKNTR
jgi:hypothetical protein